MIDEISIQGFKKFRWHNGFTLKSLKRVNVLVGPNGSGKSSFLEVLCLLLPYLTNFQTISAPVNSQARRNFYSLFEGNVNLSTKVGNKQYNVSLSFHPSDHNRWEIKSEPGDASLKVNIHYLGNAWEGLNIDPFDSHFQIFQLSKGHSSDTLNDHVSIFDSSGASIGSIVTSQTEFGPVKQQKDNRSVNERFFSNGVHAAATIMSVINFGETHSDLRLALIDEADNSLFPGVRKKIVDEIAGKVQQTDAVSQVFIATHNIEVVAAALENLDCNVYYFGPDGLPMIVDNGELTETDTSRGIDSLSSAVLISSMLGIEPKDIGLPEIPILVEELTKKTLLDTYLARADIKPHYKHVDIVAGGGDSEIGKNIENLAQMSKYFAFSQSWKASYVIFTDWNSDFFDDEGNAKGSPTNHGNNSKQKIKVAQEQLGKRFILTKMNGQPVPAVEAMYPDRLWNAFKEQRAIGDDITVWVKNANNKQKNELAAFVGEKITKGEFAECFGELQNIISR